MCTALIELPRWSGFCPSDRVPGLVRAGISGVVARLVQIAMNAWDDSALGRFWAEALGWSVSSEEPGVTSLEPVGFTFPDPVAVCIDIIAVPEPETVKNRVHIGLATTSAAHQATLVARLLDFAAMLADVGRATSGGRSCPTGG
jgi:hypothetical protein